MRVMRSVVLLFSLLCLTVVKGEWCIENDFFYISFSPTNFDSADAQCQTRGGRLATFRSLSQLESLRDVERFNAPSLLWVGVEHSSRDVDTNSNPGDFGYPAFLSDDLPQDETIFDVPNGTPPWAATEPNGGFGTFQQCVHMTPTGLADLGCEVVLFPICVIKNACTESSTVYNAVCIPDEINGGHSMFAMVDEAVSSTVASDTCVNDFSSDLASFETFTELFEPFLRLSSLYDQLEYLVGIDLGTAGLAASATFTDGTTSSPILTQVQNGDTPPWLSFEPQDTPGLTNVVMTDGGLASRFFSNNQRFMCNIPLSTTCQNLVNANFLPPFEIEPPPPNFFDFTCIGSDLWFVPDDIARLPIDARNTCFQFGGEPAYFVNQDESDDVSNFLSNVETISPGSFWTDFVMLDFSTNPSLASTLGEVSEANTFISQTTNGAPPWQIGQPSDLDTCIAVNSLGLFVESCTTNHKSLCVTRGAPECASQGPPQSVCVNNVEYQLFKHPLSYGDAVQECLSLGGRLASPTKPSELAAIGTAGVSEAWIGVKSLANFGNPADFVFEDAADAALGDAFLQVQSQGVYPWEQNEPSSFGGGSSCVTVRGGVTQMLASACTDLKEYVCEFPPTDPPCEGFNIPEEWFCRGELFDDVENNCDCNCGAVDPDCGDVQNPVFNCDGQQECNDLGRCVIDIPPEWICLPEEFNAGDGCNCGCGSADPDCFSEPGQEVIGCGQDEECFAGQTCIPSQLTQAVCSGNDVFLFYDQPLTFEVAGFTCSGITEGSFPSPTHIFAQEDLDTLNELVAPFGLSDGVWIGHRAFTDEADPQFFETANVNLSAFDTGFISNGEIGVPPWAPGQPNGVGAQCAFVNANGLIEDAPCNDSKPFVCRLPSQCIETSVITCFGNQVIGTNKILNEDEVFPVQYFEAIDSCDGDALFIPDSPEKLDFFNSVISNPANDGQAAFWAGITALNVDGGGQGLPENFENDGSGDASFYAGAGVGENPWDVGQPSSVQENDCVIVNKATGLLQAVNCFDEFFPVCVLADGLCSGRADGVTSAPTDPETLSPTPSPTNAEVPQCSRRNFGINNPIRVPSSGNEGNTAGQKSRGD